MIRLKPYTDLTPQEHEELLAIRNLETIRNASSDTKIIDLSDHLQWIESLKTSNTKIYYAVIENELLRGGLHLILDRDKSATWGIFFDPKTPLGLIASVTLYFLDRSFEYHKLKKLYSLIRNDNSGAISFNRQLGFKTLCENDDFVTMQLDAMEWNTRKETKILKNILQYAAQYPVNLESL